MPPGGKREPDDFSPYKTDDGRELKLLKSSRSLTGYFCVIEKHDKFYPKAKLDEESGSKEQKTFGTGKATPREAAIALALYKDSPYDFPEVRPRAPPGSRLTQQQLWQKKMKEVDQLRARACSLLGISEEMSEAEQAQEEARAAVFEAWRTTTRVVAEPAPVRATVVEHVGVVLPPDPSRIAPDFSGPVVII